MLPLVVLLTLGCIHDELTLQHPSPQAAGARMDSQQRASALRLRVLSGELGVAVRMCDTHSSPENTESVMYALSQLDATFDAALADADTSEAMADRLEDARSLLLVYRHYILCPDNEAAAKDAAPKHRLAAFRAYMEAVDGIQEQRSCWYPVLLP